MGTLGDTNALGITATGGVGIVTIYFWNHVDDNFSTICSVQASVRAISAAGVIYGQLVKL